MIEFAKMSGSGNDFIVLDNRDGKFNSNIREFVKKICQRRISVGADGVLLLEKSETSDFRMRYLNSDGGEVEMCGNGGRCIAYFAHAKGICGKEMTFEANDGIHHAFVSENNVRLKMKDPQDLLLSMELPLTNKVLSGNFINSGVPHVVIFVTAIDDVDVVSIGREIRYHPKFAPSGTNVDFVEIQDEHHLKIRTYERGVEQETLACGTGSTASSIVAHYVRGLLSPVECLTRGGETLTIYFDIEKNNISNVYLEGKVSIVFEGRLLE